MSEDMCRRERIRYKSQLGTTLYIHPDYINLRLDNGAHVALVLPDKVEFIVTKTIDTTKPLVLRNCSGDHDVTFVTETSDGNILIDVPTSTTTIVGGWLIYDKQGKFVRSHRGGSTTTLHNKVVRTERYQRINKLGSIDPESFALRSSIRGAAVRVTTEDHRVVSVELVD